MVLVQIVMLLVTVALLELELIVLSVLINWQLTTLHLLVFLHVMTDIGTKLLPVKKS